MPPEIRKRMAAVAAALAVALLAPDAGVAEPSAAPVLRGETPFASIGTRDGLPNASVSSIVQDAQGFLWFGTQGGLARYDGYGFKLFRHEPFDAESLPHDLVQTLYLDGDSIWVGTYGGLARLDLKTERFACWANEPGKPDSLSNDVVTCIARDARGRLWVGTLAGLNLLDESAGTFRRFVHDPADPQSLPVDLVRAIKADRGGRLWIGTSGGGLARYDYDAQGFRTYRKSDPGSPILSDYVMAIADDPSGGLWVGTWYGGLSSFDPETGRFENHPMADDRVYALCATEKGRIYVGTWGGGLFEYDVAQASFARYRASSDSGSGPGSLTSDVVYSLLRDTAGELWIGTNGGGVDMLGSIGRSYESIAASPGGMPSGKIYAVLSDRRGDLWVGVYNQGIARRDAATGAWRRYRHEAGKPGSLPNDIVNFLREDGKGGIWAGTNDGLARYDPATDGFKTMRPAPGDEDSLSSEIIYSMADDPSGGRWIGTFRTGLDYWDPATGRFAHFRHDPGKADSISDDLVTALGWDARGRLWVGTNRGLDRLEPSPLGDLARGEARFASYLYSSSKPSGISSDSIRTIYLDSREILWIGTAGGGIMRYEEETDSFVSYTTRDGLTSNTVLRILEDGKGSLWVATQAGLAIYDRAQGRFRGLSANGDVEGSEFFSGAFAAPDGSLYFGAMGRLFRFDPARYEFNFQKPPLAFTSIAAKGRAPIGAAAASSLRSLALSWRENSVSFEFAALDFRDPARNQYSYRLEGFDADWSPVGQARVATYTNLPGGSYLFRARAANNDGLWNEEGLALRVRVGFAPLANPWTIALLAGLLAGGGAFLGFRSRKAALREIRAEADGLRARLAAASVSMESAAIVDPLTGLPNRRKAEEHLELAIAKAALHKLDLSVLMIDIDQFKSYNDHYGRAMGDECLRKVAAVLASSLKRSSDFVARFGGEEFLVVLEETSIDGALLAGEKLRRAVEALAVRFYNSRDAVDGTVSVVTVSVGCTSRQPEQGQDPSSLVAAAEGALMAAKLRGRNLTAE